MKNARILIFLLMSFLCGCQSFYTPPNTVSFGNYALVKSALTELIKVEMQNNNIIGLSIALVDNQEVTWQQDFGYADKAQKIPVTAETCFFMGSITKLFTATAIMQLVEKGLIELDTPIQEYLTDFRIKSRFPEPQPITVRHLLTHHSGLPNDIFKNGAYTGQAPPGFEYEYLNLPAILKDEYVLAQPESLFAYCNVGYSLLGAIITKVSGMDFPDYIQENIFNPLCMDRSSFMLTTEITSHLSLGYAQGKEKEALIVRDLAAGSLISTTADMVKFIKMILAQGKSERGNILKQETFQQMIEPQNEDIALDFDFRIGLGYWLITAGMKVDKTASHGGDIPPFHSILITVPEYNVGVVVMLNTEEGQLSTTKIGIEAIRLMILAKIGIDAGIDPIAPERQFSEEELSSYTGQYIGPMGLSRIIKEGNTLKLQLMDFWLDLQAHEYNKFTLKAKLLGIFPLDIPMLNAVYMKKEKINNQIYFTIYIHGVYMGFMQKIKPVSIPDLWIQRTGNYEIHNPDGSELISDMRLYWDRDTQLLIMQVKAFGSLTNLPLKPITNQEAITMGKGRNLGQTIRFEKRENKEVLIFSGIEFILR